MKLTRHVNGDPEVSKKLLPLLSECHHIRVDAIPTILTLVVLASCVPSHDVLRLFMIHLLTVESLIVIDAVFFGLLHMYTKSYE
jgi:hypothetical protein